MTTLLSAARFAILASVFSAVCASAWATNQPIPGIDIVVLKKPARNALQVKTDSAGNFSFSNLEKGTYSISVGVPAQTTKSAGTLVKSSATQTLRMANGAERADVAVTLGSDAPALTDIVFTKDGGQISGTVVKPAPASNVK